MKELTLELTVKLTQIEKFSTEEELEAWAAARAATLEQHIEVFKASLGLDHATVVETKKFIRDTGRGAAR